MVKWIFHYVKGTTDVGLVHGKHIDSGHHYVDSYYIGDLDKRSFTGCVFTLFGCIISWKAMLKLVVALWAAKAEYIAGIEAMKEAI